jgi:histidinol dehydrogenase
MTDTPETNEEHQKMPMGGFTLDFARKLERERDAAIAERDKVRELLTNALIRGDLALEETTKTQKKFRWSEYQDQLGSARKLDIAIAERDELRRALSLAGKRCNQIHHPKSMQHGDSDPCPVEKFIEQVLWKQPK